MFNIFLEKKQKLFEFLKKFQNLKLFWILLNVKIINKFSFKKNSIFFF